MVVIFNRSFINKEHKWIVLMSRFIEYKQWNKLQERTFSAVWNNNPVSDWLLGHLQHKRRSSAASPADSNIKSSSLGEESDGGVSPGGEDPGLCGVKGHVQNTKVMSDSMTSKNFYRDYQRVLQQVAGERRKVLAFVQKRPM